jgi:acetylornithine deacetylase/succinyl-diaminopimelate desuccinylase-like protein
MSDDAAARKKRRHRLERIAAVIVIVIAAAATFAAKLWSDYSARELRRDQSYLPKKGVETADSRLLAEYVRIDTSTAAGAAAGARWLFEHLRKAGIPAELIESAPDRLSVYARIPGKERGNGLLLLNHIDVVPAGAGWSGDPYSGTVVGSALHGRGTLDMKGIAVTQLIAFLEVARRGAPPAHDLVFLATPDEETGSEHGMRWLLVHRRDVFAGIAAGVTEGGVTEIIRDQMTYFGIETGGKQVVRITLRGDDPERLRAFRIGLEPYMALRSPTRILPIVRDYFRSAAPTRIVNRPYLENIDLAVQQGHFWRLPLPYRELTQNTVWASDTLPSEGRWQINVHLRNLPDENPEGRIAWLRQFAASYGIEDLRIWTREGPAPVSPAGTPIFRLLEKEATRRYRTTAGPYVGYRSANECRFLRPAGIECYGVNPFPVDFSQSFSIHAANERIGLAAFADGIDFMRNVIQEWADYD